MEAVPKLPMLGFKAKSSSEATSFNNLKLYIAECYHEDADSYSKEVHDLETLRNIAVRPSFDTDGCLKMKRYYCQLNALLNRFPMLSEKPMLNFAWKDAYANSGSVVSVSDIRQEMAVILYNIGALHSQLGSEEPRTTPESMKIACTHFQCAAWAFESLKEKNCSAEMTDMSGDMLMFINKICLAQAQECILEKSLSDNRKPGIVAKVASQIVTYYNSALAVMIATEDGGLLAEVVGSKLFKEWKKYIQFKISYLSAVLFLYQGQQSEELKKMGERVTLFQLAFDKLEEAKKESKGMSKIDQINEALIFTMDVIDAKKKAAKNENEFIYHEEVPDISTIFAVPGAPLVNGISFNVTDPELMGEDIFRRLVPMKAHEGSSLYSEEKANILRTVGTKIDDRGAELNSFMASLNTDFLQFDNSVKLPQGIVDRCASLNARPNAIPDLVTSMSQLADSCTEVETMLMEIRDLLKEEDKQEKLYQQTMGSRPSVHFAELSREFQKYQEAHNKAGESNETLRKAMGLHVSNLKTLSMPLSEIQTMIPQMAENVDNSKFTELKMLLNKVNEMVVQRGQFMTSLREGINNDDITSKIVAHGDSNLEELFKKELSKHENTVILIDKNLEAQSNVLKALTDCYAKCALSIKSMSDIKYKRDQFFSALASSYDVYEDLLGKSSKGLEFYRKLQNNVQKLLTRVKAARDVQDEERQQRLRSTVTNVQPKFADPQQPAKPKLKDFMKGGTLIANRNFPDSGAIPAVRPSPLGSENTSVATCVTVTTTDKFNTQTVAMVHGIEGNNMAGYNPSQRSNPNPQNTVESNYYANQQPIQTGYTNPIYHGSYYPISTTSSDSVNYNYSQPSYISQTNNPNVSNTNYNQNTYEPSSNQLNQSTTVSSSYLPQSGYYPQTSNTSVPSPMYSNLNAITQNTITSSPGNYQYNQNSAPTTTISSSVPQNTYPSSVPQNTYPSPVDSQNYYQPSQNPQMTTNSALGQMNNQMNDMSLTNSVPTTGYGPINTTANYYNQYTPVSSTTPQSYYNPNSEQAIGQYPGYQTPNDMYNYSEQPKQIQSTQNSQQYGYYDQQSVAQYNYSTTQSQPTNYATSYSDQSSGQAGDYSQYPGYNYQSGYYNQNPVTSNAEVPTNITIPPNSVPQVSIASNPPSIQPPIQTQVQASVSSVSAPTTTTSSSTAPAPVKTIQKSENIDLLSGIDFTPVNIPIAVPTLQPQPAPPSAANSVVVEKVEKNEEKVNIVDGARSILMDESNPPTSVKMDQIQSFLLSANQASTPPMPVSTSSNLDRKSSADNLSVCSEISSVDQNFDWESVSVKNDSIVDNENILSKFKGDGLDDPKVLKWFHSEVERMEKFLEGINIKTLNGSTPLDKKWKELQDRLVKDVANRTTVVAKLFPEKNRSPDCIPFDHARVKLPTTTDDYINAAFVKDICVALPPLILAQTPLQNTMKDFWQMVWSQKSKLIICLHTSSEMMDPYWPTQNEERNYDDFSVTLLRQFDLTHSVEFNLKVTMHGSDIVHELSLLQIKYWPKNSPTNVVGVAKNIITSFKQQSTASKANSNHPVILNCLTGSERSAICSVAIVSVLSTQTKRPILVNVIDLWYRLCSQRRGVLKDENELELSFQVVLSNAHDLLNKHGIMTSYQMKSAQKMAVIEKEQIKDPLSELDPLWKMK